MLSESGLRFFFKEGFFFCWVCACVLFHFSLLFELDEGRGEAWAIR